MISSGRIESRSRKKERPATPIGGPPEDSNDGRYKFGFWGRRSFNNIESTAGTVKAMEDSGKKC
jgi:hypothetical protein